MCKAFSWTKQIIAAELQGAAVASAVASLIKQLQVHEPIESEDKQVQTHCYWCSLKSGRPKDRLVAQERTNAVYIYGNV